MSETVLQGSRRLQTARELDPLKARPRTTGELCGHFRGLDSCTVMQHFRVLEKADLVIVRREGRLRWNYLSAVPIKLIRDRWIGEYSAQAVDGQARTKSEIEGMN